MYWNSGEEHFLLLSSLTILIQISSLIPHLPIIFISTIQLLFDEANLIKSELHEYAEENHVFLEKCDIFSRRPAKSLKLSSDIESYYVPGLPITSLFKHKQQTLLKELVYMTNPIDLMVRVHEVINSLAQYFGSEVGFLSFDDTLTQFLGLMSHSPPSNAVSISHFVKKWAKLQLSDVISNSLNFFIRNNRSQFAIKSLSAILHEIFLRNEMRSDSRLFF